MQPMTQSFAPRRRFFIAANSAIRACALASARSRTLQVFTTIRSASSGTEAGV
jgi:hypothetical protein